jgi:ubiquinone/menaquinone biosynthesis C-methylase UbiE
MDSTPTGYQDVVDANRKVHTALAAVYKATEPHFRQENVTHVERRLRSIADRTGAKKLLDLGCGTGFVIDIAKQFVPEIDGVDVTEAMIQQVDRSGPANIRLHLGDTGTFAADAGAYDMVTAYSFLHHLYDIGPTLATAARALRPGGQFYADLEPNHAFWNAIKNLNSDAPLDPLVERERAAVLEKDTEIQDKYQIARDLFNQAEYNKNITGGFSEDQPRAGRNRQRRAVPA